MAAPNRMNFRKSFKAGGGEGHFQPKNSRCRFWEQSSFPYLSRMVTLTAKKVNSRSKIWTHFEHQITHLVRLRQIKFEHFNLACNWWSASQVKLFFGTGHATNSDEFSERSQTAVDPHPSEWSLSLEIIYMHFILSGPRTSLHIFDHIHCKTFAI